MARNTNLVMLVRTLLALITAYGFYNSTQYSVLNFIINSQINWPIFFQEPRFWKMMILLVGWIAIALWSVKTMLEELGKVGTFVLFMIMGMFVGLAWSYGWLNMESTGWGILMQAILAISLIVGMSAAQLTRWIKGVLTVQKSGAHHPEPQPHPEPHHEGQH